MFLLLPGATGGLSERSADPYGSSRVLVVRVPCPAGCHTLAAEPQSVYCVCRVPGATGGLSARAFPQNKSGAGCLPRHSLGDGGSSPRTIPPPCATAGLVVAQRRPVWATA